MPKRLAAALPILLLCLSPARPAPPLSTDAVEPLRFVAAHGRKALVMGYPMSGLEIWAYPFQILSGYQVSFRAADSASPVDGRLLLRRVEYQPDSIVRTYVGPDYRVREKLFVPLNEAAAIVTYEVEGIQHVDIDVRFLPVLNLMWPGAWGGQYTRWNGGAPGAGDVPGFVIAEPEHGFSAAIGSREITAHDDTVNSTVRPEPTFGFSLRPVAASGSTVARATVYVALNEANAKDTVATLKQLSAQAAQLATESAAHYAEVAGKALRIETPDAEVNQSLAWAETALDQAWVCNARLGCGLVAGYGPSRDARRPQYAWFFGGDGLVATNALVSAGAYARAREELAFIQKYQDPKSGQIWHELSQSAGFIDWSKYPYMYVHVDISFDYLATLARYVRVSGDIAFANDHWASIEAAYRYCQLSINNGDHLPHIPADKEASDEQHRPADDLGLSASWMAAAAGFAELAKLTGHSQPIAHAQQEVELTRQSIPAHYWNAGQRFWFDGHTQAGEPIFRQAVGPTDVLVQKVFSAQQNEALLDRLASADFEADWGIRGVSSKAPDYNPYSYGSGSVSALGTSAVATTFWQAHRPLTAAALWNGVLQWNRLDSLGHIHEILAGNFYHEETESVPEQTWSSAGFLDTSVRGLLGLEVDGVANSVHLTPHLPPDWDHVSVDNVRLPHSLLALDMRQGSDGVDLEIRNDGAATTLLFEPEIPLGAHVLGADYQNDLRLRAEGRKVAAETEAFAGDAHVKIPLSVPSGASRCHVHFEGGVALWVDPPKLHVGDSSSALKLVDVRWQGQVLSLAADVLPGGGQTVKVRTPWKPVALNGATVRALSSRDEYEVTIASPQGTGGYERVQCRISFAAK